MPVLLDGDGSDSPPRGEGVAFEAGAEGFAYPTADCIEIGILNNMPDSAVEATERQFIDLIAAAAGGLVVRLQFFSLPEIARSASASARLRSRYADLAVLENGRLDALIVTGNEPRAASLAEEPYWQRLTAIIDWAEHNTTSTIWSCLAAHAAVLHLDGVERRPLEQKCSGVFDCAKIAEDPILAGAPAAVKVAHSRWNDLVETDLVTHGYRVLTRSAEAGVDMFVKRWRSLFLFFQGHPEYNPDSLLREYRRDVARYLRGEREHYPVSPRGYFDKDTELRLAAFKARAIRRRDPALSLPDDLAVKPVLVRNWRAAATPIIRNWLSYLAAQKA